MTNELFEHIRQHAPSTPATEPGDKPMYMVPMYFIRRPLGEEVIQLGGTSPRTELLHMHSMAGVNIRPKGKSRNE